MGRKQIAEPYLLDSAVSLATTHNFTAVNVKNLDSFTFLVSTAAVTSGTGTFGVQVRMVVPGGSTTTNWVTLSLDATPTMAAANQDFSVSIDNKGFSESRLTYTAAGSPNGTASVYFAGLTVGA